MQVNTLMPSEIYAAGTLLNSTPLVVPVPSAPMPAQVQLLSTSSTRKIEISADGQQNWEQPPPDVSNTSKVLLRVTAPITHIRFTGVNGDKYVVL